jgi:hypothetical protein
MICIQSLSTKKPELAPSIAKLVQLEKRIKTEKKAISLLIKDPLTTLETIFHQTIKVDQILVQLAKLTNGSNGKDSPKLALAKENTWDLLEKLDKFSIKQFKVSIW